MLYRIVSDIHSEFWPESQAKAPILVDRRIPPMDADHATVLLLPSDTGSYRRRNVYRWLIERLTECFLAVYDIPGNHYGHGGTSWDTCESPAPDLGNYHFRAVISDDVLTAATLRADFQCGNPIVEEASPRHERLSPDQRHHACEGGSSTPRAPHSSRK